MVLGGVYVQVKRAKTTTEQVYFLQEKRVEREQPCVLCLDEGVVSHYRQKIHNDKSQGCTAFCSSEAAVNKKTDFTASFMTILFIWRFNLVQTVWREVWHQRQTFIRNDLKKTHSPNVYISPAIHGVAHRPKGLLNDLPTSRQQQTHK